MSLEHKIKFLTEIDALKSIYRRGLIKSDGNRRENTAEHSWHVTLMAVILAEFSSEEVSLEKVMKMLLIHDLVEIYAGDTYAFDVITVLEQQAIKELEALDKIVSFLPQRDRDEMKALWLEFEEGATSESKFAKAVEKSIPVFQNMENNGGSWTAYGVVSKERVLERNKGLADIAPQLWAYVQNQVDIAVSKGWLQ